MDLEAAIAGIDAANAEDPSMVEVNGAARPAELVYSERMSGMLEHFAPDASSALKLAARAQHLRRWTVPRNTYPMDRAGYHRWRSELKRLHAEWAAPILTDAGIAPELIARVQGLIRKENLARDAEAQTLEDCACLVFLEHYADGFAVKHDPEKMITILRKTWAKMSPLGRTAALRLPLSPRVSALVEKATNGDGMETGT